MYSGGSTRPRVFTLSTLRGKRGNAPVGNGVGQHMCCGFRRSGWDRVGWMETWTTWLTCVEDTYRRDRHTHTGMRIHCSAPFLFILLAVIFGTHATRNTNGMNITNDQCITIPALSYQCCYNFSVPAAPTSTPSILKFANACFLHPPSPYPVTD